MEKRDKCNRTIHDVATDDCKDLLENLGKYSLSDWALYKCDSWLDIWPLPYHLTFDFYPTLDWYIVVVQVLMSSPERLCPVDLLEDGCAVGKVTVQRHTSWEELTGSLSHLLTSHLQLICGSWELEEALCGADTLGLSSNSMASVVIGKHIYCTSYSVTSYLPRNSDWFVSI